MDIAEKGWPMPEQATMRWMCICVPEPARLICVFSLSELFLVWFVVGFYLAVFIFPRRVCSDLFHGRCGANPSIHAAFNNHTIAVQNTQFVKWKRGWHVLFYRSTAPWKPVVGKCTTHTYLFCVCEFLRQKSTFLNPALHMLDGSTCSKGDQNHLLN